MNEKLKILKEHSVPLIRVELELTQNEGHDSVLVHIQGQPFITEIINEFPALKSRIRKALSEIGDQIETNDLLNSKNHGRLEEIWVKKNH
jgi:hypothetical protein